MPFLNSTNFDRNVKNIISNLGIKMIPFNSIKTEHCNINHEEFSRDSIYNLFQNVNVDSAYHVETNIISESNITSGISLGDMHYQFEYINDDNKPLFSHSTIGTDIIITLNKAHYFFSDDKKFMLQIITLVHNINRDYANQDLYEDVQYIFNPPATIRINYKN